MSQYTAIAEKAAIVYIFLVIVVRLLGKRTLGKLTVFDLIISIIVGRVAAEPILSDTPVLDPLESSPLVTHRLLNALERLQRAFFLAEVRPQRCDCTEARAFRFDPPGSGKNSDHSMRVAQIAPLYESVPPPYYGGTERVIATLTETLVARGHEVTLFATADSTTAATLVPCCDRPLRTDGRLQEVYAQTAIQLDLVYSRAGSFDIIHNHVDFPAFPLARVSPTPTVTTLHGRLDLPEIARVLEHFDGLPLVAVSHAQRSQAPLAQWAGVVHHGIPFDHFTFRPDPGSYLAFVGRISLDKRVDRAIEIARTVRMPLKVAAKVGVEDGSAYYEAIKPLLEHPLVEFLGEVDEAGKDALLGGAYALLFPIDWPEPFGLTMVEAMATGTPVIAYDAGAVREVVDHETTGFVCRTLAEMIQAVPRVSAISREACRRHVEARFSPDRMADEYERIYRAIAGRASAAA